VAAQFANGDWTRPVQIEFFISKPYWETWWFRIGAAIFLFGAAYLLYASSSAARKKREQLGKELNTSKQMALGSQVSPHFVFNSLNAIYNFLLKNKGEIAQVYLVRFSRLIRNVFENSMERYIPLSQELDTLKLYLELEQLRFSNKFSYTFHVAEDIRQDSTYIPPMLLQPLIENAIWHGLLNKEDEEPALLQIQVEKAGDILQFMVKDNGVGLSQVREKQKTRSSARENQPVLQLQKKEYP
jgi:LytS/YehU family sensor histidine kinase